MKLKLWSISFSYRLGLGFHALNNEGNEGTNLMQPRRIEVGNATYDGISGEIIRHHILENFVNICRRDGIDTYEFSSALHPDRGMLGIRHAAKEIGVESLSKSNPTDLYGAIRNAIKKCAVLDVGGYLAAWTADSSAAGGENDNIEAPESTQESKSETNQIAPEAKLKEKLAKIGKAIPYTVKRDSVFDAAWLISESPQTMAITQHSAYRPSGQQSLYSQTMRSNIYGGVIRANLYRIGTDDYWYLQPNTEFVAIEEKQQRKRQMALVEAIVNFIASPTGAKAAGWAPHVFLTEGVILLSNTRTAPFVSPIKVDLDDAENPVQHNPNYISSTESMRKESETWVWKFEDVNSLLGITDEIKRCLGASNNNNQDAES